MAHTQIIPTKFPEQDVRAMDKAIRKGLFISRSDIVRSATREKLREYGKVKSDKDLLVMQMKEKGDFESLEGNILSKLFLENKPCNLREFTLPEQKEIKKLLKHPMGILTRSNGKLYLTQNGKDLARGFLKALAHERTLL